MPNPHLIKMTQIEKIAEFSAVISGQDPHADVLAICKALTLHLIASSTQKERELMSPDIQMLAMLAQLLPDLIRELAVADIRAIAIVAGERYFNPGELANILEGRALERASKQ